MGREQWILSEERRLSLAEITRLSQQFGYGAQVDLGKQFSDSPNYEAQKEEWSRQLDELLGLFSIEPDQWTERLTTFTTSKEVVPLDLGEVKRRARGQRLGHRLLRVAYRAMPIEYEEEGDGRATATVRLSDDISARAEVHCGFWTERSLVHPLTSQRIVGDTVLALEAELEEAGHAVTTDAWADWQTHVTVNFSRNDGVAQ